MSVYSYTRTSQIECLETSQDLETILEKEDLRLQTYALGEGMKVGERFLDHNQKWNISFMKRPQAVSYDESCRSRGHYSGLHSGANLQ